MFKHEFKNMLKDPRRFIFIFGAGLIYLFMFATLYQPNIVQKIPTVIFDEDQSKLSREIVQNFSDSDIFEIVAYARDESEMLESIQMKRSLAAIQIPKYFARDRSSILYMVNGSNIIMTSVTSSATLEIVESFEEEFLNQPSLIHLRSRILYNPTQGYMKFFVIGLSLIAFQQGLIFAIGAASFDEGSIFEKIFFYWILSMLSFAIIIFAIENFAEIELRASMIQVMILGGIFSLSVLSFGSLFAAFFKTEIDFIRASILYPVPAFILSGYTFPIESMPSSMQILAKFFPITYFSNDMRDLFLIGKTSDLLQDISILLAMSFICQISLRIRVRKSEITSRDDGISLL